MTDRQTDRQAANLITYRITDRMRPQQRRTRSASWVNQTGRVLKMTDLNEVNPNVS